MDVTQAINIIGQREMVRRAGVSVATVERAKRENRLAPTKAGRKMLAVIQAEGLGNGTAAPAGDAPDPEQQDLPIDDPLLIRIKKEELRKKAADAEKQERLNAEAEGRLVPVEDVAARHGLAGSQLRATIDAVRRDMDTTLCDGCREVVLSGYDAGWQAGIQAALKALEGA